VKAVHMHAMKAYEGEKRYRVFFFDIRRNVIYSYNKSQRDAQFLKFIW